MNIAIFGTGAAAERAIAAAAEIPGLSIVAVADNDPARRGTVWQGHRVGSAEDLVASQEWEHVCVASQWHADIASQLMGLGVLPHRIAVFNPWGEGGLVAGVDRLQELFQPSGANSVIPGFEEDFDRLQLLQRLGFSPDVVLDVGASNGPWSVTCAGVFPNADYYLVEPLPHYEGQWLTARAAGWHRLSCAVGAEDGEATIAIPTSKFGAFGATLLSSPSGARPYDEALQVPLRRVDTLLAEGALRPPQLVKLDVQGYEAAVLAGGQTLWESTEVFFVELSLDRYWAGAQTLHEMIALFAERGFLPFDFFHQFRGRDGALVQIDCVFLRRDGPFARSRNLWKRLDA